MLAAIFSFTIIVHMVLSYPQVKDTIDGAYFGYHRFSCGICVMHMDFIPGCDFTDPRPVLLDGVAQCKGASRPSWITKCVILMNESGVDVAWGICHSVNIDLVIDNDGMSLGND